MATQIVPLPLGQDREYFIGILERLLALVADALGVHPNYLSALARQQAGSGFQAVLEEIRMENTGPNSAFCSLL